MQFHGDYGPGGGFQAGVIFARRPSSSTPWSSAPRAPAGHARPVAAAARGRSACCSTPASASSACCAGGNFLDYTVLADDPVAGQHLGILLVELGVGITVFADHDVDLLRLRRPERRRR